MRTYKLNSTILAAAVGTALALNFIHAFALGEPVVPGKVVRTYATISTPQMLAFDETGALYVGNDPNLDGGGIAKLYRIGPMGSPITQYGNTLLGDPDAVAVDSTGLVSGIAGSVLVGGNELNGQWRGCIWAIKPDQTTSLVFASSNYQNTQDMSVDSTGRLLFCNWPDGKVYQTRGLAPTVLIDPGIGILTMTLSPTNEIFLGTTDGRVMAYSPNGQLINDHFATGLDKTPPNGGASYLCSAFSTGGEWGTNLYVLANGDLMKFNADGTSTTIGSGFDAQYCDMAFGPDNGLYITETNLRVIQIVPEPASISLLLAGAIAGLVWWRRRARY